MTSTQLRWTNISKKEGSSVKALFYKGFWGLEVLFKIVLYEK